MGTSKIKDILLNPSEHSHYRWLTFDQIDQTTLHPAVIKIILTHEQQIKEFLK